MIFKFRNNFTFWAFIYLAVFLSCLFLLTLFWLPPGFNLAGHDSGLPLDAKQFLKTRLFAWDDRLGFGLDNSANFGSLTLHFFDFVFATIAGTPYAGNFISLFFWLGIIFTSSFIFAYQLKDTFGKPFIFILPPLLTFNFYIFQSVFMLERAKFSIFASTLLMLAIYFRMVDRKLSLITSSILVALIFSIFNGGGWFGITLYGGVSIIVSSLIIVSLIRGFVQGFDSFKRTCLFVIFTLVLYLFLNSYSILSYYQNFLGTDAPRLAQETASAESHKDWLRYVSRSTYFANLLRLYGVPDWYGEYHRSDMPNESHPYADLYINNKILIILSFIFPFLVFLSFIIAKARRQKQIVIVFGVITFSEMVFAAGSNSPFGFIYEFLMDYLPGFFIFRSAFYKFGVFYMLGVLVLLSVTLSILIEKTPKKLKPTLIILVIWLWMVYHFVLFNPSKIFYWNENQSTRMQVPSYIYDFNNYVLENDLSNQRILLIPPENPDWQNDAYSWGYWSLSPITYSFSPVRVLSNWHGLTSEERSLVTNLYSSIKANDETNFTKNALKLNVGFILLRSDVLTNSKWAASEGPENYKRLIDSFKSLKIIKTFGQWQLYRIEGVLPSQASTIPSANLTSDSYINLADKLFPNENAIGLSSLQKYPEIKSVAANKIYVYDCLSCFMERQIRLKSLPDIVVLPGSPLYYFKEKREQALLNQSKDSRSLIGDYLGIVLTRSGELKKMLDLSAKEEKLINSMEIIRFYLDELHLEISKSPENATDFLLLSQILDFLSPVERELSDYLTTGTGKDKSHRFGEEMLGVLWDINRIKDSFKPILENRDKWANEKVYKLIFPESGNYSLSFLNEAFPKTLDNKIILPKQIKVKKGSKESLLKLNENKVGWQSVNLGYHHPSDMQLTLLFDELPNLFNIEETKLEEFSFGKVACLNGRLKNFDRNRAYEILVSKTDRLKNYTVIFKDRSKSYSEKHGFLKGEDLFEIPVVAFGEMARYVYFPSSTAKDIFVYICSDDKNPPQTEKMVIREFFSPAAVVVKTYVNSDNSNIDITLQRINPVKFEGEIKNSEKPFVLVFNEKMNSLWQLYLEDNKTWVPINKHFMVNGYANGWLIEKADNFKFKIEYTPQSKFITGSIISLTTFLLSLAWLIYAAFRRSKKHEKF